MAEYTEELINKPSNIDILLAIANNWAKGGANVLKNIPGHLESRLRSATTMKPVHPSEITTEHIQNALLGPEFLSFGAGIRGAIPEGIGSFLGRRGNPKSNWTPDMQDRLRALGEKYKDTPGKQKLITKEFREMFPEYTGSDSTIQRVSSNLRNWGGANIEGGAKSTTRETELGAFGGRGRLRKEEVTPAENVNWLQSKIPVTEEWVKNWAKDADVPIKEIKKGPASTYIKLEPDNPPLTISQTPTVRIPTDKMRHHGFPIRPAQEGSYFDTGLVHHYNSPSKYTGITSQELEALLEGKKINKAPVTQHHIKPVKDTGLINEAGMSYADPAALDAALKWRLSKAPHGGNWLIPEDMAPRFTPKKTPQTPIKPEIDPDQLKLLSSGIITPEAILNALRSNNGQ